MGANNPKRIIIRNSVASATAADNFEEVDGHVQVLDPQTGNKEIICRRLEIIPESVKKTTYAAAVARVATLTFTAPAAVGTLYSFKVTQWPADAAGATGEAQEFNFAYESVSGDNATNVADALEAQWDAFVAAGTLKPTANNAAGVITATGASGGYIFKITVKDPGSGTVLAYTTPGNPEINIGTAINAKLPADFPEDYYATTTGQYTTYEWRHNRLAGESLGSEKFKEEDFFLALESQDANTAAIVTVIDNMIDGLDAAGSAASSEALAIGS